MSSLQDDVITGHAVLLPLPVKGHWPGMMAFATRLVKRRPKTVCTILVAGDWFEKTNDALDFHFVGEDAELRNNIRVLQLGGEGLSFEELMPAVFEGFTPYFVSLASSSDILCKSGMMYPGIRAPDVLIIDTFYYGIVHMSRSVTEKIIPVYGWLTVNTVGILRFVLEDAGNYFGNVAVEAPILAKKMNKTVGEITYQIYHPTKGEVVNLPGFPQTYDYELRTEQLSLSAALPHMELWNSLCLLLHECDGMLGASDPAVEPEANEALRAWFSKTDRDFYPLGYLSFFDGEEPHPDLSSFLSRMLESHGEHSVVYISFGTYFAPQGSAYLKIIEVILDMGIPLIFSSASGAKIPPKLFERMKQSDKVYTSSWVAQKYILGHQATGAFITHCGQNSFTEAIVAGVPMIAYPLAVDQPFNAVYISRKFNIGYELMETRLGTCLRPAYRGDRPTGTPEAIEREIRDVLGKIFGPDGEEKRRNIRLLWEKCKESWDEGGKSTQNFERLIKKVFPPSV